MIIKRRRLLTYILMLIMVFTATPSILYTTASGKKVSNEVFSYRVDCLDSNKQFSFECLAMDVLSSVDGTVYAYSQEKGKKALTGKEIMEIGYKTEIAAGEECCAYIKTYSLYEYKVGQVRDIYVCFEDNSGKVFGPYVKKNYVVTYFPAGDGSVKNPYQIWTERHLYNIIQCTGDKTVHLKLMQSLNLKGSTYTGPCCDYASSFQGSFDGNKKSIWNMSGRLFYRIGSSGLVHDLHLIGHNGVNQDGALACDNEGSIKSCSVINSNITGGSEVGGLVAENHGIIKNCEVNQTFVTGSYDAGGIAGINAGKIEKCYAETTVNGEANAGGIVGKNRGVIHTCLSNAIFVLGRYSGGIAGVQAGDSSSGIFASISTYQPMYPDNVPGCGSIVGYGGNANTALNIGGLNYIPIPEINEKDEDYQERLERWAYHHGTIQVPYTFVDPIEYYVDINMSNFIEFFAIHFAYKRTYDNETAAYNKKYPLTVKNIVSKKAPQTPGKVTITSAKKADDRATLIKWKKVKGADGYEIYKANALNGVYKQYVTVQSADDLSLDDRYLSDKQHYYRVRAYKMVNGRKVYGAYSERKAVVL